MHVVEKRTEQQKEKQFQVHCNEKHPASTFPMYECVSTKKYTVTPQVVFLTFDMLPKPEGTSGLTLS